MQHFAPKPILKPKVILSTSTNKIGFQPLPKKLLDRVSDAICFKHYSYQTEKSYVQRIRRFILFHNIRHSSEMGGAEVNAFTEYVAAFTSKLGVLIASDRIFLAFTIFL